MTRETSEQEKVIEDPPSSIPPTQEEDEEETEVLIELSDCLVRYCVKPWLKDRSADEWINIFDKAAVFQGDDKMLWGRYLACVYREPKNGKLSCLFVDRLGVMHLNSLDISNRSRFYPAIANLVPEYKTQNVHKCIAVGLLKKYSVLDPLDVKRLNDNMVCDYDQTTAGDLANSCELIGYCAPRDLGITLVNFGLLQPRFMQSLLLDVVYSSSEDTVDANNQIVYYLGEQLEQLFDPLTEYSPEPTEVCYKPPEDQEDLDAKDEALVVSICDELLRVQTSFTLALVEFLQKFLIPLRIAVLRDEHLGLSTVRLNRLFPPTIDEVTRINCIFLDSLRSAIPYGALEIMRACNITVPYFYKAYARHEAATKHFSKDIKYFMNKFATLIPYPNIYTESKLDTLIRGPQEKLMKLKLIIDRLCQSKTWDSPEDHEEATKAYGSICNVIDSFGRRTPSTGSYSNRVFTPSGKILTELAKGWPSELQYKWLKRRIVGVFDVVLSNDDTQRDILVIFSDYVVFLNVIDGYYYYGDESNKPLLSDVLMNSLINEVPLPSSIPNLHVRSYCYIDDIHVSIYGKDMIRFDALGHNSKPKSFAYKLASSAVETSYIADLCTKAKILEKNTAFHLFKTSAGSFNMYSIAHELQAYKAENIKSSFVVFLNLPPSADLLKELGVEIGFFTALVDDNKLEIKQLNINGDIDNHTVSLEMFISFMVGKLSSLYSMYFSSSSSPIFERLLQINANLVDMVGDHFCRADTTSSTENDKESEKHTGGTPKDHHATTRNVPVSSLAVRQEHLVSDGVSMKSGRAGDDEVSIKSDRLLEKHRKGKNIFNKLTKLFRKKKDKKVKVRRATEKPLTLPVKSPVQNVKKTEPKATIGTNEKTPKKHRHSSVTHNAIEAQALHERAMRSNLFGFAKKSYSMQDIMASPENDSANVEATTNAEIQSDVGQGNSTSKSNNVYNSQANRLSKIFNDDLFGEIISSRKGTGTEESATTTASIVDKVGDIKRKGSFTSEDANGSFENPQQIFKYPPTKENEEDPSKPKPIYNHVKIQMDRSPSLVELFGDMRQVLDENDERANWRRLSSDRSLNDRYQIKPNPRMVHLFSQFTNTKESFLKEETKSETNSSLSETNIAMANVLPRSGTSTGNLASNSSRTAIDVSLPIPEDNKETTPLPRNGHISMNSSTSNKALDGDTALNRNGKGHGFIVTKATPARIWNKEDFASKVSDTRSDITDVSSISSLRKVTDRLLEFSINSQEDLGEENFFTPVINPEDTFSNSSSKEKSDSTMDLTIDEFTCDDTPIHAENQSQLPASEYSDLSVGPQQSPEQQSANQPPEAILDELEFSTFHMSFDNSRAETSSAWEGDSNPKTLIADQIVKPRSAPDPLFYKLPESLDEVTTVSTANKRNGTALSEPPMSDEAVWVSPSKLDFYDLSTQPDSVYRKTIIPQRQLALIKTLPRDPSVKFHESTISKDNSYIYLGQFVSANNAAEYAEEKSLEDIVEDAAKPQRLTFSAGN